MDPLSWALMTWLAIAVALFVALQKAVELWPPVGEDSTGHGEAAAAARPVVPTIAVRKTSSTGSQANIESDTEREARRIVANTKLFGIRHLPIIREADQEPEADVRQQKHSTQAAAAAAASSSSQGTNTNPTDNAKWLNEFIGWLHHRYKGVPDAAVAWLKSLNDAAKKVTSPSSCEVLFEHLIESSRPDAEAPRITNIRTELGPRDHLTFIADIFVPEISLHLVSSQKSPDHLLVSNYDARITELRGEAQVRLACIANELFAMGCFNGRPGMRIELVHTDANTGAHVNPDLVAEAIRKCIISAVTNISLNQINTRSLTVQQVHSVDSAEQHSPSPASQVTQVPRSTVTTLTVQTITPQPSPPVTPVRTEEIVKRVSDSVKSSPKPVAPLTVTSSSIDKLLVKVIRAQKLGAGSEVYQPFVCMELDEPSTRQHTTKGLNLSPYWEEEFTFDLSDKSEELLFEIYDGYAELAQPRFLGLAIVSLAEIRKSTQCIQTLPLQSRPYYNDSASGSLTVEFIFMPATNLKPGELGKSVREQQHEYVDGVLTETEEVTRRSLGQDEAKIVPTTTTTVMIKSVSQYFQEPTLKPDEPMPSTGAVTSQPTANGEPQPGTSDQAPNDADTDSPPPVPPRDSDKPSDPAESSLTDFENQDADEPQAEQPPAQQSQRGRSPGAAAGATAAASAQSPDTAPRKERARSKESVSQSGSFFTQLADRMSFSTRKGRRSRSVDARNQSAGDKARDPSEGRYASSQFGGSQTEQSIVSGVSTRSLYARSTLIVELTKNDVKKFYLIPPNMLDNSEAKKLMRRGKKLHVFNEHTFVAVRIRGGSNCNVCGLAISRSFGRQAYQCRDCRLVCHKQCHHKTDVFCPNSNVSNLEMRMGGHLKSVSFNETVELLYLPKPAERTLKRVHMGRNLNAALSSTVQPTFVEC